MRTRGEWSWLRVGGFDTTPAKYWIDDNGTVTAGTTQVSQGRATVLNITGITGVHHYVIRLVYEGRVRAWDAFIDTSGATNCWNIAQQTAETSLFGD